MCIKIYNLHYEKFADGTVKCIEDEIPFEIPNGWAWCRYSNAIQLFSGQDLTPDRYNDDAIGIPYITGASNMENGRIIINRWTSTPTTHAAQGDLLLTVKGSGVGKMAYCDISDAHIARQIMALRCNEAILYTYLEICVSASIMNLTAKANGLIPGISRETVLSSLMPLPPLSEQRKIGLKVNQLLDTISYISCQDEDLKSTINTAKSKILDLAIRGKLVPQDQNDEPASVLLERIRSEKEALIKSGKIKRDKKESVIFRGEDNSYYQYNGNSKEINTPYEIPENWTWVNLAMLSALITKGTTPRGGNVAYVDSGIGFLRAENIAGFDKLNLQNLNYVTYDTNNDFLRRSIIQKNDILITIAGTLGRTALVEENHLPLNANQAISIVRLVSTIKSYSRKYIIYAINSPTIKTLLLNQSVEMAIPNLSLDNIANCFIPLPPLAEQQRIVEAIETAFAQLDAIAQSLS